MTTSGQKHKERLVYSVFKRRKFKIIRKDENNAPLIIKGLNYNDNC